jgi:hypothetical protein
MNEGLAERCFWKMIADNDLEPNAEEIRTGIVEEHRRYSLESDRPGYSGSPCFKCGGTREDAERIKCGSYTPRKGSGKK